MVNEVFKRTAKKLVKAGFFHGFTFSQDAMSYKHHDRVFSLQRVEGVIGFLYSSGYVYTATRQLPTFESEYNSLGPVEVSHFAADYRQGTDNPSFIVRQSMYLIGFENFE